MLGPLNQHIGRKLASLIVAFGLACTFQPTPASAGNDNASCQPSIPHDLLPSEFEELREELWSTENIMDVKLKFDFSKYPFFPLLLSAKYIDRGRFVTALITLEGIEFRSQRVDFCQYVFISEIILALRHTAIKNLLPKDSFNLGMWNGFGHGALRYFTINDYRTAKCIILNARVESLKLDREPAFEEYPRHCVVR